MSLLINRQLQGGLVVLTLVSYNFAREGSKRSSAGAYRNIEIRASVGKQGFKMLTDGLSLVGFIEDQRDALAYLERRCSIAGVKSRDDLKKHWQAARAKLGSCPVARPGEPDVKEFPKGCEELQDAIVLNPRFTQEVLKDVRAHSFRLVEIDPLFAFQYDVDTSLANSPVSNAFELCLPRTIPVIPPQPVEPIPPKEMPNGVDGGFRIANPSLNMRYLGCDDATLNNTPDVKLAGVVYGPGIPWVQVISFNGKCFLSNGYHRALRLRRANVTHVPCLFLEANRFERIGIKKGGTISRDLFASGNPPTFAHFSQDRAYPVRLRLMARLIEVTYREFTRPQR